MVDILLAALLVAMLIAVGVSQRTQGIVKPVFPLGLEEGLHRTAADESDRPADQLPD